MITPGQTLENPVTGERFMFTDTATTPGITHSFSNVGDTEARLHVEVRPALRMEEMFAEAVALARAGRMTHRGLPRSLLDLADLARRYDREAHAPLLSVGIQRLLLAPLVFAARHPRTRLGGALTPGKA